MLLQSPFHGSTKLDTHISFVAVAIFKHFPLYISVKLYTFEQNVQGVDGGTQADTR
jgi:hypothetical protein